jgi:hypothetical protein
MGRSERNMAPERGLASTYSGEDPVAVSCEHGNEPLSYIKGSEFLIR